MNRLLFFLILFLFLGAAFLVGFKVFCPTCQAVEKSPPSSQIASPAPHFVLKDLNGREVKLADFQGKNLLLVFWATWCGYCAKEKPDLVRFTSENKEKIEVVAVVDEPREMILAYIEKEGINFQILLDEGRKTFNQYQALGTPTHFLINSQGEIVGRRPGYASYNDLLILRNNLILTQND